MALPNLQAFTAGNNADINAALSQWTTVGGRLGINTNAFYPDTTGGAECGARLNTETGVSADQYSQVEIAAIAATNFGYIGAAIRCATGAHSYYGFYGYTGNSQFFKEVSGTWTQFGSDLTAVAVGDVMRIEAVGTTIRAIRNGVQVATTTDSSLASGHLGISGAGTASTTASRGDNFQGGEVSVAKSAPTLVGSGTADFTVTSGEALTPGLPTGWAADDIHILVVHTSSNVDIPTPTDWTPLLPGGSTGTVTAENNGTGQRVELFWRRAVGGDSAPSVAAIASTAIRGAWIIGIRGCPTTGTPFSGFSRLNDAAGATDVITTVNLNVSDDDTLGLFIYAYEDDPTAASQPTNWSTATIVTDSGGTDMALGYFTRTYSANGSYGTPGTTVSGGTFSTNSPAVSLLLAFQPAIGGAAQTLDGRGASEQGQAGTLTLAPVSTQIGRGALGQDRAGAMSLVPGAILVDLRGAIEGSRAGALALAATVSLDQRGALEMARAGPLQTPPGTAQIDTRGALEADRAGSEVPSPGQVDIALRGATEREIGGTLTPVAGALMADLAGALERALIGREALAPGPVDIDARGATERDVGASAALAPGAVAIDGRGTSEGDRAGPVEASSITILETRGAREGALSGRQAPQPGAVTIDARGAAERDRGGSSVLVPGAVAIDGRGASEGERTGALDLAAAITLALAGATEGSRIGALTLMPGVVTIDLRGDQERDRAGTIDLATAPAQTIDLIGTQEGARAGTGQVPPGPAFIDLRAVAEGGRAGAVAIVPGAVTITLMGERALALIGALALAPEAITAYLAGAVEGTPAGSMQGIPGTALVDLRAATEGERAGATSLVPGAVVLTLVGVVEIIRGGMVQPFEGGITITVDLVGGRESAWAGAVLAVVGVSFQISGPTQVRLADDGRRQVRLVDDGRRIVRLIL